jgi:cobalamin synthase
VKAAAYAALVEQSNWISSFITTPALGRWSTLILTAIFRYAGTRPSVTSDMGRRALVFGTVIMIALLGFMASLRAVIAAIAVALVTIGFGFYCRKRIGGVTGDTLGANVELSECVSLLVFLWIT